MISDTRAASRRWTAAAVGALAVAGLVAALFRAPPPVTPREAPPLRGVVVQGASATGTGRGEEAWMRDLTPLFLPTGRNAGLRRLPAREPGKTFLDLESPKLALAEVGWSFERNVPPPVTLNEQPLSRATPLDYLESAVTEGLPAGFGRLTRDVPVARERAAVMEVIRSGDGRRLVTRPLDAALKPPTDKAWQPLEFLAAVGPAGLVAPLTVTVRSGVDEVDAHFRKFLSDTFRVGDQLAPGFYRILIVP